MIEGLRDAILDSVGQGNDPLSAIIGQEDAKEKILASLLASHHILIAGPPGIGCHTPRPNLCVPAWQGPRLTPGVSRMDRQTAITLGPSVVHEACCMQQPGIVIFILEFGGRPIKAGVVMPASDPKRISKGKIERSADSTGW